MQVRALPGARLSINHLWTKPCITWATCLDTFQNRFLSHGPRYYLPSESRAFGNTRPGKYRGSSSPNSVTQSGDPELRTQTRSRIFAMFAHCLHVRRFKPEHSLRMLKTKQQTTNVLDFFHSENRNVHVIHCTTTSFHEHPTRITSICARFGGTGEKRAFVPDHPPLSKNEIDAWEKEILAKFQDFMEKNPRVRWVHCSMTDDKFGWPLIRRRSLEHKITDHTQSS